MSDDVDQEIEFDPFAELSGEVIEEIVQTAESEPQEAAATTTIGKGSIFVFDLETVPDESRFPRPVRVEKVKRPDLEGVSLAKLITLTVPVIKQKIPLLSEEQLLSLHDSESNSKKPRVGVLDAIDAQIAADNADDHEIAMMEWRKNSFNPFANKIVALGIEARGHSVTMIAKNEAEERELIRVLWEHIANYETRCGYNITAFDDAVLIFRSMLLGIDAPRKIQRKKFANRESIDLMLAMFPSSPARKLKEVCKELGIVPLAGYEMSGDQVFDLVEKEFWDEIATYVHSDAVIEFELYRRLNEYMVF